MSDSGSKTLYDFKHELPWVRRLGWSDEKLRKVPLHDEQSFDEPFLSLPLQNVQQGGLAGLYVYKNEVAEDVWADLVNSIKLGGPSGREQQGIFGRRKEDDDIPRPY